MTFNDYFLRQQANPDELSSVVLRQGTAIQQVGQSFVRVGSLDEIAGSIGELAFRARDANGNLRMIMSAINLLEELGVDAHFAGVDQNGVVQFWLNADNGKLNFSAEEFPSITPIEWVADDTGAVLGRILSFYVVDIASGMYMLGQGKDSNHYGVSGLAAMTDAQTPGQYKMLLQLDTQNGGRAFVEQDLSGTLRRAYLPAAGWLPYVMQDGASNLLNFAAASATLTANGHAVAIPVRFPAPALLRSVSIWNNDTTLQRTWNWSLFWQERNTGDSGENTQQSVSAGTAAETFTAAAASLRTIVAASAPKYIGPGLYWLVVQNQHASNSLALGVVAGVTALGNLAQAKVITNPMGSTLDFVAATWSKFGNVYGVRLNCDVFGQTSAF
jgi:hypothetical protein